MNNAKTPEEKLFWKERCKRKKGYVPEQPKPIVKKVKKDDKKLGHE